MEVSGSVAVITGAARGIGLALAKSLAAAGAKIVIGDVLAESLDQAVQAIRAAGGCAVGVVCDVTKDEDVARLMDTAVETFGAVNVVCANAGIARDALLLNLTTEHFRAVMDVNVVGPFITFREAARRMADNGWPGVLIVTSSINRVGQPGQINYSSSKAAVALWPKILAGEFHSCGLPNIRVVAIAPGYTATEGLMSQPPGALDPVLKDVHLGRLVKMEELASTVKLIIENEAINATTIEVSGGATYGPWQRAK